MLPPAAPLALAGMAFVGVFALWKAAIAPRFRARKIAANI
jgi:hypothetical protein